LNDEGYCSNGVKVFVINFQKLRSVELNIMKNIANLPCYHIKYLKIIIKRPLISFIEGTYSTLNGRPYTTLGSHLSFVSITGENFLKRKFDLLNTYQ
jgi:hypothetical protein